MNNKIIKLYVLRIFIIFAATTVIMAAKCGVKAARPFEFPLIWLRHYVLGSGKALRVPDRLVKQAKGAFMATLSKYYAEEDWYTPQRSSEDPFGAYHCLYHSTLYKGSGFYDRPTLFYLLGGFTFLLRRDGKVSGKDWYDWHANSDGNYFTSPLGKKGSKMAIICRYLDKLFGNEWFVEAGFPSEEPGISNKLWDDLHLVGARPFWSWFDQVEIFSEEEKMAIVIMAKTGFEINDTLSNDNDGLIFRAWDYSCSSEVVVTIDVNGIDYYYVDDNDEEDYDYEYEE